MAALWGVDSVVLQGNATRYGLATASAGTFLKGTWGWLGALCAEHFQRAAQDAGVGVHVLCRVD